MLIKSLKFTMVLAVLMTFLGGTAMAGGRGDHGPDRTHGDRSRDYHHAQKWDHHYPRHHERHRHYQAHKHHVYPAAPSVPHHQPHYQASGPHPLAPRIVFLGPIPVPVPPPPHEVIGFLTGHR